MCLGCDYITIYISWFFIIFYLSYPSFNNLSNMVQTSVQYYPCIVKKNPKIEISLTFTILKVSNWKKSWVCGNYFRVFLQKNSFFRLRGWEI
jgi:hypothetical protein